MRKCFNIVELDDDDNYYVLAIKTLNVGKTNWLRYLASVLV